MLERLGVPADDDQVYLVLLRNPGLTRADVAEKAGLGDRSVGRALARLTELGVVSPLAGRPARYVAAAPDTAVEVVLARYRQAAALAKAEAELLLAMLPSADSQRGEDRLELVAGPRAVRARLRQVLATAERELLVLGRLPGADAPEPGDDDWPDPGRRGVRGRRICSPADWTVPGRAVGESTQVRIHDRPPTELVIADRAVALLPFVAGPAGADGVLVVRSPQLLGVLVLLFEMLWEASVPPDRRADAGNPENRFDERLLLLLAAGLKDEAIARQLGVSLRTLHRRTSDLLDRLGVRTRFQAGMRAAQQGLLSTAVVPDSTAE
ncbi:helix-turn-helix domain-containing protein [Amycolatopsis sp. NPDC051128]|uniref:helix-turn-helix domain-containing protein n=1 Tax=Amycolatopsis sp. NPDC051128 TaxID=3155412 RepID=UPI003423A4C5